MIWIAVGVVLMEVNVIAGRRVRAVMWTVVTLVLAAIYLVDSK